GIRRWFRSNRIALRSPGSQRRHGRYFRGVLQARQDASRLLSSVADAILWLLWLESARRKEVRPHLVLRKLPPLSRLQERGSRAQERPRTLRQGLACRRTDLSAGEPQSALSLGPTSR